ncbi:acylneuraminate cytidylyltransferase family protein [Testudinibacter sp. TR-2022]|uniref:acylneuraminate cytidylyltransferase family protein n=1 Tax=Testudinibacter sp. TR-2022 TaxID=2585029 RepID=UPI001119F75D|nr:acylneuraminate cytidylyltransferase family protein [Testudinibacter sp. TR-2022]TNH06296.1 acylneuraminate cytidylyltransferase family protein [Pasteurellaceae bacterium Phil11]TNH19576.1 acylneuraminate cytidylyltransferase family protein [Testudinibacter sp. TR-2022]TNH23122.1 acylneuraminate cytidylyltransferase family protein [Testudinibacter sp. TR-2022]
MQKIAIILARAGSKGIPNKNLQLVKGISLIGRAIISAQQCSYFNQIIVSTDGTSIAKEAEKYGAEVIIRPEHLATDRAKSIDSLLHVFSSKNITSGLSVMLQPTSPFRTSEDIMAAVKTHKITQRGLGCVVSVKEMEEHPYKMLIWDGVSYTPISNAKYLEYPRQSLPRVVKHNGAIYVNRIEDLIQHHRFFIEPIGTYLMPEDRSIDIDTVEDLLKANL